MDGWVGVHHDREKGPSAIPSSLASESDKQLGAYYLQVDNARPARDLIQKSMT